MEETMKQSIGEARRNAIINRNLNWAADLRELADTQMTDESRKAAVRAAADHFEGAAQVMTQALAKPPKA